jgi:hypothetical protein
MTYGVENAGPGLRQTKKLSLIFKNHPHIKYMI